jgi:hypothetical protein
MPAIPASSAMLVVSETLRIIFSMVRRRCDPGQRFRSTGGWRTDYTSRRHLQSPSLHPKELDGGAVIWVGFEFREDSRWRSWT